RLLDVEGGGQAAEVRLQTVVELWNGQDPTVLPGGSPVARSPHKGRREARSPLRREPRIARTNHASANETVLGRLWREQGGVWQQTSALVEALAPCDVRESSRQR